MDVSTISATTSAVAQLTSRTQGYGAIEISAFLISSGFLFTLVKLIFVLGKNQRSFEDLKESVNKLTPVVTRLNSCVQEIQSVMKNRYKTLTLMQETMDMYGIANSPIVLKEEFKHYILESGLSNQIEENKPKIIEWLKKKNPITGLDAQNFLMDFVVSDKIDKYLDTREFKKLLYDSGKTAKDYYFILAIYLFEVIIPEVIEE